MREVPKLSLRSLPIEHRGIDATAARIVDYAQSESGTGLVVPVNCHVFTEAYHNPALAKIISHAEIVVPDGAAVSIGMSLLRNRSIHRAPGVDLIVAICETANSSRLRILLLGGLAGAAEKTQNVLEVKFPGLTIASNCPPFGFEQSPDEIARILEVIHDFRPHIVFVAFGVPKQEFFMEQHLRKTNVPVAMAVGGSFEMLSGMIPRAPRWVRTIGIEWLFRLMLEPRRLFKRYLYTNTEFCFIFLKELCSKAVGLN
jgi:N-acetylglucosaminyldiphosphoundecaprenol N-acetyl-beta-D-mannosaminyltransferase